MDDDADVCTWAPDPDADPAALTYTFGGVPPVARPAGHRAAHVDLDCFAGRVRGDQDLLEPGLRPALPQPADRPVLRRGRPARRHPRRALRAASRPRELGGQHDGAVLRLPDGHADHGDAARPRCPSGPGSTQIDTAAGWSATRRATRPSRPSCRSTRCTARSASPLPSGRSGRRWPPATGAATWTPRRCAPASPATSASTSRARCSASGTGTRARARARPAASPWSARWTRSSIVDRRQRRPPTAVAAARERRLPHDDGVGAPARGRVPDRAPADGAVGRRAHRPERLDAYQLVSQVALTPVANVVDTELHGGRQGPEVGPRRCRRDGRPARQVALQGGGLTGAGPRLTRVSRLATVVVDLGLAQRMSAAARGEAAALGALVSAAVVDAGGHLVAFERMDGAEIAGPVLARDKAYTAVAHRSRHGLTSWRRRPRRRARRASTRADGGRFVCFGGGAAAVVGAAGGGRGRRQRRHRGAGPRLRRGGRRASSRQAARGRERDRPLPLHGRPARSTSTASPWRTPPSGLIAFDSPGDPDAVARRRGRPRGRDGRPAGGRLRRARRAHRRARSRPGRRRRGDGARRRRPAPAARRPRASRAPRSSGSSAA